jgi:hypothetical protein
MDDEEFTLDVIRGDHGKKRLLSALNRKKLSRFEMDELFSNEE